MTREEILRKIKYQMNEGCISESDEYYEFAKAEILDIIASLQQERPDNEDVDKVAQELYEHLYELKRSNNVPTNLYDKQEIINLWKAGIEYGRNHPKQGQPCKDLEKAAVKYTYDPTTKTIGKAWLTRDVRLAFIAGAKWQKEQMLKDAQDARIYNVGYPTSIQLNTFCEKYQNEEKVKVIIVKEN